MTARSAAISPAHITFADGALYSTEFGDIYHSSDGALEEARHVFLRGNSILDRWHQSDPFTIVETGFGCGLNFLTTWDALRKSGSGCRLDYVSVEKHPFTRDDLTAILGAWPQFDELAGQLLRAYPPLIPGYHRLYFDNGHVCLTLLFGDALEVLTELDARADAFFLDGFAPAKNPDMWSDALFDQLRRLAASGATAATYSSAAVVRTGLERAGFTTQKKPGFGRKRDMMTGRLPGERRRAERQRKVIVIGAGVAGASCVFALARRGFEVEMLDREAAAGKGSSSNPAAVVRPFMSLDTGVRNRFGWSAFAYAVRLYRELTLLTECGWNETGVLQLARDPAHWQKLARAAGLTDLPADLAQLVNAHEASSLCGVPVSEPGIWFPMAGFVNGSVLCNALINSAAQPVALHGEADVHAIREHAGLVGVFGPDGRVIAHADLVILANGVGAQALFPGGAPYLQRTRGQVTRLEPLVPQLLAPVCRDGYVTPQVGKYHYVGATFDKRRSDAVIENSDHLVNLQRAERILPEAFAGMKLGSESGWAGVRCASRDRLPVFGQLDQNLFCCVAMGSRGFSWAPLAAEAVASLVAGAPSPLERSVLRRLSPLRFAIGSGGQAR